MPKSSRVIRTKLPRHDTNKPAWRRAILNAVMKAGVVYEPGQHLEVAVLFYLQKGKGVSTRDVDNLLKHVLDAFQARFGQKRGSKRLIENDNCVQRVVVEKRSRPKNLSAEYGGKLVVRPYTKGQWP